MYLVMDVKSNIHSNSMYNHIKKAFGVKVRVDTFQFTQMFTNLKVSPCVGL